MTEVSIPRTMPRATGRFATREDLEREVIAMRKARFTMAAIARDVRASEGTVHQICTRAHLADLRVQKAASAETPPPVDRDPCPRCGIRADLGCHHSRAPLTMGAFA